MKGQVRCVCFVPCWQAGSRHGWRAFQESMKRKVKNVALPCPVCVLDWLRLFLHLMDTIPFFQTYLLVLSVLLPGLFLTSILVTNLNAYVKDLSVSSKASLYGRGVVQHHRILSVGVFWLNVFKNKNKKKLRHSICRRPYKYKHCMPPSCRNPSFLELSVPTVGCIFFF